MWATIWVLCLKLQQTNFTNNLLLFFFVCWFDKKVVEILLKKPANTSKNKHLQITLYFNKKLLNPKLLPRTQRGVIN